MGMSTEKKVGLFFLLALITLGVMIELVEEWHPFEKQLEYRAYFNSAVGIRAGDPVRLAGVEVGKVDSIDLEESRVVVKFGVEEGTTIRKDSIAEIRQANLLGGQFLGITFGSESSPVLPSDSALQSREGVNIDQLITNIDRNQERVLGALGDLIEETKGPLAVTVGQVENIVRKIDQGDGTLGRLVNDPRLYDDIQFIAGDLKIILDRLEKGEGTLGRLLTDPSLYDEANSTVANLRIISDRVREGKGSVGRLFADEGLYDNASDALANIRDISDKANRGTGTLGKLVNDDSLYDEARGTMTNLNSITKKIDGGEGTLGRLVNEDDIYRDAKTTLNKVEKAVDGISDTGPLSALGVVLGTLF
jgi:phospholipid/cholesterol/gamma-HCH transport system substrate-binding protein